MTTNATRRLLRDLAAHGAGPGKRYPAELRAKVTEAAHARVEAGESLRSVAADIGVRFDTLQRWCQGAGPVAKPRAMRAVEIVAEAPTRGLTVVTPNGLRVECGSVEDAVALLRALA